MTIAAAREIWRRHRLLAAATALATLATLVFLTRFIVQVAYWETHRDAQLQGWMTVGYVARSYQVDREVLLRAVDVEPGKEDRPRLTLGDLAARRGEPLAAIEADLRAAIAAERSEPGGGQGTGEP